MRNFIFFLLLSNPCNFILAQSTFRLVANCGGCDDDCNPSICSPTATGSCTTPQTNLSTVIIVPAGNYYKVLINEVASGSCESGGGSIDGGDELFLRINGNNGTDLASGNFESYDSGCILNNTGNNISLQVVLISDRRDEAIDVTIGVYSDNACNNILPVKIKDFTIQPQNKNALISWITTYEKDASHFLLQRSFDGTDFSTIKEIPAQGHSSTQNKYTYEDINPKRGNVYYRLVQVDVDRSSYTYKTEMIHFAHEKGFQLLNTLIEGDHDYFIMTSDIENYELSVIDLSGRVVLFESNLSQEQKINTSSLQKGIYILNCKGGGEYFTSKIIKR